MGYNLDLAAALDRSLGVRLEVRQANLDTLETWLDAGRIDLEVGGIQTSPQRAVRHQLSQGYQQVHLALVVPDAKVALLQNLHQQRLNRPLLTRSCSSPSWSLPTASSACRSSRWPIRTPLQCRFSAEGQRRFDGLLTTAEGVVMGGAAPSYHPDRPLRGSARRRTGGGDRRR